MVFTHGCNPRKFAMEIRPTKYFYNLHRFRSTISKPTVKLGNCIYFCTLLSFSIADKLCLCWLTYKTNIIKWITNNEAETLSVACMLWCVSAVSWRILIWLWLAQPIHWIYERLKKLCTSSAPATPTTTANSCKRNKEDDKFQLSRSKCVFKRNIPSKIWIHLNCVLN